jgi:hypothetical protein
MGACYTTSAGHTSPNPAWDKKNNLQSRGMRVDDIHISVDGKGRNHVLNLEKNMFFFR